MNQENINPDSMNPDKMNPTEVNSDLTNQPKIDSQITAFNRFKVTASAVTLESDPIAVEEPLQISLVHRRKTVVFSITMRTPGNDIPLIYGLLFSEGIIQRASDIQEIVCEKVDEITQNNLKLVILADEFEFDIEQVERRLTSYSSCGLCGKSTLQTLELKRHRDLNRANFQLNTQLVHSLKNMLAEQPLFSQTGGVHAAGFIEMKKVIESAQKGMESEPSNSVVSFYEDVGRHNALDKVIGQQLIEYDLLKPGLLLLSGRIGFELVQKAAMAGISTIVALGAPSSLAIKTAVQFEINLIGFAKDHSFNFYTPNKSMINQVDSEK